MRVSIVVRNVSVARGLAMTDFRRGKQGRSIAYGGHGGAVFPPEFQPVRYNIGSTRPVPGAIWLRRGQGTVGCMPSLFISLVKPVDTTRNCGFAACARGLTRFATFVSGSRRPGNERHSVGWS